GMPLGVIAIGFGSVGGVSVSCGGSAGILAVSCGVSVGAIAVTCGLATGFYATGVGVALGLKASCVGSAIEIVPEDPFPARPRARALEGDVAIERLGTPSHTSGW